MGSISAVGSFTRFRLLNVVDVLLTCVAILHTVATVDNSGQFSPRSRFLSMSWSFIDVMVMLFTNITLTFTLVNCVAVNHGNTHKANTHKANTHHQA